jgi:hypothetical protein
MNAHLIEQRENMQNLQEITKRQYQSKSCQIGGKIFFGVALEILVFSICD